MIHEGNAEKNVIVDGTAPSKTLVLFICGMTYADDDITIELLSDVICDDTPTTQFTGANQILDCFTANTITYQNSVALGASILLAGGTTMQNCNLINDSIDGIQIEVAQAATTSTGVFVVDNVSVTGASDDGLQAAFTTAVTSQLTIANSDFSGNGNGFYIPFTTTPLTANIANVMTNNNMFIGIEIEGGNDVTVTLTDVSATNNGDDGVDIEESLTVTLQNVDNGIDVSDVTTLTLTDETSTMNGDDGVLITFVSDVTLMNVTANSNGGDGVDIEVTLTVTLQNVEANNNMDNDIEVFDVDVTTFTLTASTANNNGLNGLDIDVGINTDISDSVFCADVGLDINNDGTINMNDQNTCFTTLSAIPDPLNCAFACMS
jgi:hypothetical protein